MKKLLYLIIICAFVFNSTLAQEIKNYSEKELIIKLKSDVEFDSKNCLQTLKFKNFNIDALNKTAYVESIKVTGNRKIGRTFLLTLKYNSNIEQLVKDYMDTGLFEFVVPNHFVKSHGLPQTALKTQFTPNDEHYNRQWFHYNDGTFPLSNSTDDADMDTDLAWDVTQGDPNIIVAVIDSGLKLDHPEFAGRLWINSDEVLDGTDTDNNGYIDDLNWGWDFVGSDNTPEDEHAHGTGMTGTALANGNNGIGLAGVNWNSKIMVCKVMASNGGSNFSWLADAIYYAVDNGADVINFSLGFSINNVLIENAVNYAFDHNVAVVCSAGNGNGTISYPAKYESTFAIGATDPDDTRSIVFDSTNPDPESGSNFGLELDFVAPGNFIYGINYQSNTDYEGHFGGTSFSAAFATGVISLLLSVNPNLTIADIRATLEASSEDQVGDSEDTPGWDQYYGHGRINAYDAVTNIILGLEENTNLASTIIVYPNPVLNDFTIENIEPGSYKIMLYDLLGSEQYKYSTSTEGNNIKMTIPKLSSGIYFLNITETSSIKNTVTKKIIIQ